MAEGIRIATVQTYQFVCDDPKGGRKGTCLSAQGVIDRVGPEWKSPQLLLPRLWPTPDNPLP